MSEKSLVEILLSDGKGEETIVKSFYPQKSLSPVIFDKDNKINDDVRKKLISISDSFMDYLDIDFFVHDIVLTGSLANYGWSKYSDVDLHIIIDFDESNHNNKLLKEFFDSKIFSWNETHDLKIKNFDVEIYIQDIKEDHISSGVYSILNNKWLIIPDKKNVNIDERKILEKGDEYMNSIDGLIKNYKNGKNVKEQVSKLKDKLKSFRKTGLSQEGEYSYENLTFKLLRRNGYIKKLIDLKNKISSKELSLKEIIITESQLKMITEKHHNQRETYFDTFSAAVQYAREYTENRGYVIDEDDWFNRINTGPGKPKEGQTFRTSLGLIKDDKPQKKMLHIQVYNMGLQYHKNYELNFYVW